MFQKGEYIIYKRDLCQIEEIEDTPRGQYYKLIPVSDKTLRIKVPCQNSNIRPPISKEQAEDLIKHIPSISPITTQDKLLESQYRELMKTNLQEDLIKIIKTTYQRNEIRKKAGKKAGDKDIQFFNQAEFYLYSELAYALEKDYDECKEYIIKKVEASLPKNSITNE